MTNRNINAATLLEQYSVLVEKEQWGDFFTRLIIVSAYCNCNCNISTGSPLSKLIFSGALHIHTNIHKTKLVATY